MLLLGAASLVPPPAQAQTAAPGRGNRADPLDAQARVPAITHVSALAAYRRLADDRPIAWTQANETVHRIGGWRAYAREAQQPDAVAPSPAAGPAPGPAAAPLPARNGHHHQHGGGTR